MKKKYEKFIIPRGFYESEPENVAPKLLGKYLVKKEGNSYIVGKIVEVEAYLSSNDPAAHNFKGPTRRNKSLFSDAGKAYIHSLRQHCLIDVVTEGINVPGSVLIRALEPFDGIELMKENRRVEVIENISNGPGKLCKALNITRIYDNCDLTNKDSSIFICSLDADLEKDEISIGNRIGISKATNLQLRFYIKNSKYIST